MAQGKGDNRLMADIADPADPIRNTYLGLINCGNHPTFVTMSRLRCHHCDWTEGNDCSHCSGLGFAWILHPGGWRVYPSWSAPLDQFLDYPAIVTAHNPLGLRDSFGWRKNIEASPSIKTPSGDLDLLRSRLFKPDPNFKRRI